jgi:hypothetical protein
MMVLAFVVEQLPRLAYLVFSGYALVLVVTAWPRTRVMTTDKRFLLLFFLLEIATTVTSAALRMWAGTPADPSTWLTVLCQSFLCAYLYYAIPRDGGTPAPGR